MKTKYKAGDRVKTIRAARGPDSPRSGIYTLVRRMRHGSWEAKHERADYTIQLDEEEFERLPSGYDSHRLSVYVEKFFARSDNTEWPTVKQAARSLRWTMKRVEDAIEGDPDSELFMSSYFTKPEPTLAEHFIERYNPLPAKAAS